LDETNEGWEDWGFKWSSWLPPAEKVFAKGGLFLSHGNLLETLAYLHEYRLLTVNKANEAVLATWNEKRLPAYCRPIFEHFLAFNGGDPTQARGFISALLGGNIDIATGPERAKGWVFYVETAWPFFVESTPAAVKAGYMARILRSVEGLTNVSNRGVLFGPRSNWREVDKLDEYGLSYNHHLQRLERNFLEALRRRHELNEKILQKIYGQLDLNDLFLLIETSDFFNVKQLPDPKTSFADYITGYIIATFLPLIPSIAVRILQGKPVGNPMIGKKQKWENTLRQLTEGTVSQPIIERLAGSIEDLFNIETINKFFDGIAICWYSPLQNR
jgi:hypothetical protein